MNPTPLVCLRVTSFVNLRTEGFLKYLILRDRANFADGFWLEVDVVSGSMLFDALDASRYASLNQPAIVDAL